ncbi:MAG: 2-oxo acid dehydrogenase subunit E2, partial [Gammaproteobacteria bacterium]|nr:2-oxo acid dehydrogenase subunit E2 [Gammaproteobacteria bacterium]
TILSFAMKVLVNAMKKFPAFNASLAPNGEALILKKYFNIGIAVDTPNGLVVPVIQDVDRKSIFDLARDLAEVSERARDGKLKPTDLKGGCISISSLGGIGGCGFTPIINAPEVAIIGLSRSKVTPVWNGKEFEPRIMLPIDVSYDHRVIDGAEAARFAAHLVNSFSDVRRLAL